MKIVKEHIINESFIKSEKNLSNEKKLSTLGVGKIQLIRNWLDEYGVNDYTINDDMTIDLVGSSFKNHDLQLHSKLLHEFPDYIQFGTVKGWVDLRDNKLTSLRGCPHTVGSFFDCAYNKLTSLKYGPSKVGGDYECFNNLNLISLEGAPDTIYPTYTFNCSGTKLSMDTIIEYKKKNKIYGKIASNYVGVDYEKINNPSLYETFIQGKENKLSSLGIGKVSKIELFMEKLSEVIWSKFTWTMNSDFSIDINVVNDNSFNLPDDFGDLPDFIQFNTINGSFDCSACKLTTLKGMPLKVTGDFKCHNNNLTSLKYAPIIIGGLFTCYNNHLLSLENVINYLQSAEIKENIVTDFKKLNVRK